MPLYVLGLTSTIDEVRFRGLCSGPAEESEATENGEKREKNPPLVALGGSFNNHSVFKNNQYEWHCNKHRDTIFSYERDSSEHIR